MVSNAKSGGSITPEFMDILQDSVKRGRLQIMEKVEVKPVLENESKKWRVQFPDGSVQVFDKVWLGTGASSNVSKVECLQTMLREHPIPIIKGFPMITNGTLLLMEI
jgi:pyruvate/2-oxoglutarate dehydrogenase complex dihydrolipoamide dehydrogenase (E3) component